jgi:hypothetical protein
MIVWPFKGPARSPFDIAAFTTSLLARETASHVPSMADGFRARVGSKRAAAAGHMCRGRSRNANLVKPEQQSPIMKELSDSYYSSDAPTRVRLPPVTRTDATHGLNPGSSRRTSCVPSGTSGSDNGARPTTDPSRNTCAPRGCDSTSIAPA